MLTYLASLGETIDDLLPNLECTVTEKLDMAKQLNC
ncbi:hypothetical protein SAMN05421578_1082 [Paenibacillus macquariensis]|uniref:Uncharacterized protein n=1 Tax=Paenibacillus macquariensis TaxID=948756 RepID=A0ABY1K2J2_9BACL|nr:hypothetical protein SAMN05421578_1082 [Paenibacillus macquariensis]